MTADIAHELRNPLAVQRANLEALQDGVYPLKSENLAPVLEQNQLLTRLVEDLHTLALAESGQIRLECTPSNFPALVKRVAERFDPQAGAQDIHIQFTAAKNLPPVELDPGRIEQILNNLIANALRHTQPGGRIELSVGLRSSQSGKGEAVLTVRDTGPGIPAEALPHIFERFYRADRSRSRAEGGTGLGLAIARQLAEAHGGSLAASNHPQGGAIFTLVIPQKAEPPDRDV
jgi:signal transduction histidine kinase